MRLKAVILLASIALTTTANTTVKGTVKSVSGQPIEAVAVSDGHQVTLTDSRGRYSITSPLDMGYLFVSTPGNYEPAERLLNRPKFWQNVSADDADRDVNFVLKELPADSTTAIIAVADLQISNRAGDRQRLRELYVPELNHTIDSLRRNGLSPVVITLGDQTCDYFWYNNNYTLADFNADFTVNAPVYHTMGNHDNDPYKPGDMGGASTWHAINGPSYYSFNRGGSHVIVLDNMLYNNAGGAPGHSGKRDYKTGLTKEQLEWLKNDLATVADKSAPLFITMHGILLSYPVAEGDTVAQTYRMTDGGPQLGSLLSPFQDVRVLSGHAHNNHFQHTPDHRIREYNYAAACGSWWPASVTPYQSNMWMARDGSPWGYGIWDLSTSKFSHTYQGFAMGKDYQMRVYDLNCVEIADTTLTKDYKSGDPANRNVILANIWAYEPGCTVAMYENGKKLDVKRVIAKDPMHFMLRAMPLKKEGVKINKSFMPESTAHMFRATASHPDTDITVVFTDLYGHTFTSTLKRPHPLKVQ